MERDYKLKCHTKDMWYYLHTVAAYLPLKFNDKEKEMAKSLIEGVLTFGTRPDKEWNEYTEEYLSRHIMNFKGRDDVMLWLCYYHNEINKQKGKELFLCSKKNLLKRWYNPYDNQDPKL